VWLLAFVVAGALLVLVTDPPDLPSSRRGAEGPLLVTAAGEVERVSATLRGRGFGAVRQGGDWRVDGAAVGAGATAALEDLVETLRELRAIDAFRTDDPGQFGFAEPQATIEVGTPAGSSRLLLGVFTPSAVAVYARLEGDPRVFQVGSHLLSAVERVLYLRDAEKGSSAWSWTDRTASSRWNTFAASISSRRSATEVMAPGASRPACDGSWRGSVRSMPVAGFIATSSRTTSS